MVLCGLKVPANHLPLKCFVSLWPPVALHSILIAWKLKNPQKNLFSHWSLLRFMRSSWLERLSNVPSAWESSQSRLSPHFHGSHIIQTFERRKTGKSKVRLSLLSLLQEVPQDEPGLVLIWACVRSTKGWFVKIYMAWFKMLVAIKCCRLCSVFLSAVYQHVAMNRLRELCKSRCNITWAVSCKRFNSVLHSTWKISNPPNVSVFLFFILVREKIKLVYSNLGNQKSS